MSVPDVIEANAIPNGADEPHGIIYKIRDIANDDVLSYVSATAQTKNKGSEEEVVKWSGFLRTSETQGSYMQFEFKKGYVFPTFYSFKGSQSNGYICKEWDLYGLNTSDGTPERIASNTSVDSTFCYPYSGSYCGNDNWGTFAVHNAKKAYKYFRIIARNPLKSGYYRVTLAGFELFGIYSKDGRTTLKQKRTYCFKSYPIARHVPLYLAARFCLLIYLIK